MIVRTSCVLKLVGAGAAPMVALFGVRVWLEAGGPAAASAQVAVEPIAIPTFVPLPKLSESQTAMRDRMEFLNTQSVSSPFPAIHGSEQIDTDPKLSAVAPVVEPEVSVEPPPRLVVTAIMGGRVPVAMIDGRPRSVGDVVDPGWTIQKITQNGVVIVHGDGRTATFGIQRGTP